MQSIEQVGAGQPLHDDASLTGSDASASAFASDAAPPESEEPLPSLAPESFESSVGGGGRLESEPHARTEVREKQRPRRNAFRAIIGQPPQREKLVSAPARMAYASTSCVPFKERQIGNCTPA